MRRAGLTLFASVSFGVSCGVPAPPGPRPDLELLVRQLDDPERRISTAQTLIAQGEPAGPALMAELERAVDAGRVSRQREALRLLRALGPAGGGVLEPLLALSPRLDGGTGRDLIRTVAELAPYRPTSLLIDEADVGMWQHRIGCEPVDLRRLFVRAWSDGRSDLPTLIAMAGEVDAHRIELAVEALDRMGPRARAALPCLAAVLDRPDPRVTGSTVRVPLRACAARAVLRIDPRGVPAARARAVLAGEDSEPARANVPEEIQRKLTTLVAAFAVPEQREIAAGHLIALGPHGSEALLRTVVSHAPDPGVYRHALGAAMGSGEDLAHLVPELAGLLVGLAPGDRRPVLDALSRAAPCSRDVVVLARQESTRDLVLAAGLRADYDHLQATLDTPAWLPDRALAQAAASGSLARVERATTLLARRGPAVRVELPTLAAALNRDYAGLLGRPMAVAGGGMHYPRSAPEFRIARCQIARAILAIAAADDPLAARARQVIEQDG